MISTNQPLEFKLTTFNARGDPGNMIQENHVIDTVIQKGLHHRKLRSSHDFDGLRSSLEESTKEKLKSDNKENIPPLGLLKYGQQQVYLTPNLTYQALKTRNPLQPI